jgi:hypothetical protein
VGVLPSPSPIFKKMLEIFEFFKSFLYAFGSCKSYRHQIFHGIPLGPEEGREGIRAPEGGVGDLLPAPFFENLQKIVELLKNFGEFNSILAVCFFTF